MSAISDRYRRLADEFGRRVAAVRADRWDNVSPCAEWTARDVLRHVVDTERSMPDRVGLTVPDGPSVDEDPLGAWATVRDAMLKILEDPDQAGREYDSMFGRSRLEDTVGSFLSIDLVIHGWDIARATGGDEHIDPEEVRLVAASTEKIGDKLRGPGAFGPEVPVPADADAQSRLLAFLGRTP
jgi:uncharacterized protein (TIGR03086 family)